MGLVARSFPCLEPCLHRSCRPQYPVLFREGPRPHWAVLMTRLRAATWAHMTAVPIQSLPVVTHPGPRLTKPCQISPRPGLPFANRAPLLLTAWLWAPTHLEHLPKNPPPSAPPPLQGCGRRCSQSPGPMWGPEKKTAREAHRADSEEGLPGEDQLAPQTMAKDVAQHRIPTAPPPGSSGSTTPPPTHAWCAEI